MWNQHTRNARDLPGASGESLRGALGNFSPSGTFDKGYTDIGGGIARNGNAYTNIGANGQATAMSQGDSRTPDQIANAARINADTARFVAQREQANRVSPGQQYLANMERQIGLPIGEIASKSLRASILAGAQQADKTGADNEALLQKENIASADRRMGHQVQLGLDPFPRTQKDSWVQDRAQRAS